MGRYILRRLLLAIPTIIGVTLLIFLAMRLLPGVGRQMIANEAEGVYGLSDEELAEARASLGLDRWWPIQYLDWLRHVASGDMGYWFSTKAPMSVMILRRAPLTTQIAIMAVLFSWCLGVPLGTLMAAHRNSLYDYVARAVMTVFLAMPSYWLGLLIVLFTVLVLSWRPPLQIIQLWEDPLGNLAITVLPSLALGVGLAAEVARMTRSATLEVMYEDHVRTARAKGLKESTVVWRHVFKNSMRPVVTFSGLALGALLGGAVATEKAFGIAGVGSLFTLAVTERNWPMVQNLVLLYAVVFAIVNLLVDVSYAFLDPRIRYE